MSEAKHTPGPWAVNGKHFDEWEFNIDEPKNGVATSVPITAKCKTLALVVWEGRSDDEGEANAALAAAAPDLYAALEHLIHATELYVSRDVIGWIVPQLAEAQAALKLATEGRP